MTGDMDKILELFPNRDACADAISALVVASGVALTIATDEDQGTIHNDDDGHLYWGCCSKRLHYYPNKDHTHADTCWTHGLRAALENFGATLP